MSMEEKNRLQLISLMEKRIGELDIELAERKIATDSDEHDPEKAPADPGLSISGPINKKVISDHKLELAQLNHSRKWLESEYAGYCKECDCEIPIARLKAVLDTRLCIACAEISGQ
jgi:RNA polymerase-binding transcription factor DksA